MLSLGVGDIERLKHIRDSIEQNKPIYQSDRKYVENLVSTQLEIKNKHSALNDKDQTSQETSSEPPTKDSTTKIEQSNDLVTKQTVQYRGINRYKNEALAVYLASLIGFLGFFGLGHRYVGNIRKSLALLFTGWFLLYLSLSGVILSGVLASLLNMQYYYPPSWYYGYGPLLPILLFFAPVGYLVVLVWQTFDARKVCRKYNQRMDESGTELYTPTQTIKIIYTLIIIAPLVALIVWFMIIGLGISFPVSLLR